MPTRKFFQVFYAMIREPSPIEREPKPDGFPFSNPHFVNAFGLSSIDPKKPELLPSFLSLASAKKIDTFLATVTDKEPDER